MICLRSAWEVFQCCEQLDRFHHHKQGLCAIESIQNLEVSLIIFRRELFRVLFQKNNLRHKKRWWLPTFYSLCIQSAVKSLLVQMKVKDAAGYLEYPRRLFIAMSQEYDPIWPRGHPTLDEIADYPEESSLLEARSTFQTAKDEFMVTSSADMLRKMFDTTDTVGEGIDEDDYESGDNEDPLAAGLSSHRIGASTKSKCADCNKEFAKSSHLIRHMRRHKAQMYRSET